MNDGVKEVGSSSGVHFWRVKCAEIRGDSDWENVVYDVRVMLIR